MYCPPLHVKSLVPHCLSFCALSWRLLRFVDMSWTYILKLLAQWQAINIAPSCGLSPGVTCIAMGWRNNYLHAGMQSWITTINTFSQVWRCNAPFFWMWPSETTITKIGSPLRLIREGYCVKVDHHKSILWWIYILLPFQIAGHFKKSRYINFSMHLDIYCVYIYSKYYVSSFVKTNYIIWNGSYDGFSPLRIFYLFW
jgi:hypothetical protein